MSIKINNNDFICGKCKICKPLSSFYTNKHNKWGHLTVCIQCIRDGNFNSIKKKHTIFTCKKCKIEKPLSSFWVNNFNKWGHRTTCKECGSRRKTPILSESERKDKHNAYYYKFKNIIKYPHIRFYQTKKEFINLFGGKCSICGYDKCQSALEFHHLDPNAKEFSINSSTLSHTSKKWNNCIKEASKCILVCNRCHREQHNLKNELIYEQRLLENTKNGSTKSRLDGISGELPAGEIPKT